MAVFADPVEQARLQSKVLIESLPYLREYHGETVVIKYGGHAMTEESLKLAFARNISLLKLVGIHPVVVHGGGPQINEMLSKAGDQVGISAGAPRDRTRPTMDVVEMVLVGSVNKSVVTSSTRRAQEPWAFPARTACCLRPASSP